MVLTHQHVDGHRYNIHFYRIQSSKDVYVYVCDFNADFPSHRSLICDGRYSDLPTTTIVNVGSCPYAFRAEPTYPGVKLAGCLERGESATVFSEFRVIPYNPNGDHVYYVHAYKLIDESGWIPDFDPQNPNKRMIHDKCGFPLEEVRHMASSFGLKEIFHNSEEHIIAFNTADHAKVIVYYATGTVATSMHHPRQGITQLFRRNQTLQGLRDIFLNPGIYTDIGYIERGKKRGPNSPAVVHNINVSPPSAKIFPSQDIVDEEEAIQRQLKRIETEEMFLSVEKKRLTAALESYERHRIAERRREQERTSRLAQQQKVLLTAERNMKRGTEMICHASNSAFVRKHWEAGVTSVAFGTKTEFLVFDDGAMACSNPEGLPEQMLATITQRSRQAVAPLRYCALGSYGRYFLSFGTDSSDIGTERLWVGPESFTQALTHLAVSETTRSSSSSSTNRSMSSARSSNNLTIPISTSTGKKSVNNTTTLPNNAIKSVSFGETEDSWIILFQNGTCWWNKIPARLELLLIKSIEQNNTNQYNCGGGNIEEISLGPTGEWFLLYYTNTSNTNTSNNTNINKKNCEWDSHSSKFLNSAKAIKTKITAIYFGSKFTYLIRHL